MVVLVLFVRDEVHGTGKTGKSQEHHEALLVHGDI